MARFLLDFDSTTADLSYAMMASCNNEFDTHYTVESITHWNWTFDSIPQEQCSFIWKDCFESREWTLDVPPLSWAIQSIKFMQSRGHTFVMVSDRKDYMQEWLEAWNAKNGLENVEVIISNSKTRPKLEVAKEYALHFVIEDAPHHVNVTARDDFFKHTYLLDYAYNRDVPVGEFGIDRITRVMNWKSIVSHQLVQLDMLWKPAETYSGAMGELVEV